MTAEDNQFFVKIRVNSIATDCFKCLSVLAAIGEFTEWKPIGPYTFSMAERVEIEKGPSCFTPTVLIRSRWPARFAVYFRIFNRLLFSYSLGLKCIFLKIPIVFGRLLSSFAQLQ